ncbi:MAG: hypothetical protein ABIJ46_04005, partial [bacterium]
MKEMDRQGAEFLHRKDDSLHISDPVEHEQKRRKRAGESVSERPAEKIANWIELLGKTHMGHKDDSRVMDRIRSYYHRRFCLETEDVPDEYWRSFVEKKIREGRGGDLEDDFGIETTSKKDETGKEIKEYVIPEKFKEQQAEILRADQESSLDKWFDYLTSDDSKSFPLWAKYWAFTGMLKLGRYDKGKGGFSHRTKGTVAPFPDLNREALAEAVDTIVKRCGEKFRELEDRQRSAKRGLRDCDSYDRSMKLIETGVSGDGREIPTKQLDKLRQKLRKPEHGRHFYEDELQRLEGE